MFASILRNQNNVKSEHNLNRYIKFITSRLHKRDLEVKEVHHIIPISMESLYKKSEWNLIELTPREHLIAHLIFAYAFGDRHWISLNIISNANNPYQNRKLFKKLNSSLLAKAKIMILQVQSQSTRYSRATEPESVTQGRIEKWRLTYGNNPTQLSISSKKGRITRQLNLISGKSKKVVYPKQACRFCNKLRCLHNIIKHERICEDKLLHKQHNKIERETLKYVCDRCNKIYSRLWDYNKHKHKNICCFKEPIIKTLKEPRVLKQLFICEYCGRKFRLERRYKLHIKNGCCLLTKKNVIQIKYKKITINEKTLNNIHN